MKNELTKHGWQERTIIDDSKLQEIIKEYESIGFEVHLESVTKEDFEKECGNCYLNKINKFKTVYVRKKR
ncbi:MAG: hypothetical protein P8X91_04705 [Candidatus Bathyarchaeota archaeon]